MQLSTMSATTTTPARRPAPGRSGVIVAALALLAVVALLAVPDTAQAADDEWTVGGGFVSATIPTQDNGVVGVGASAHVRYGLSSSFSLALGALYSHHFPSPTGDDEQEIGNEPIDLFIPRFGIRYALDILDLVPYLLLDATAYVANEAFFGGDQSVGAGLMAGLGLEYRPFRSASFGLEIGYHAFLMDIEDYPVYISLGLHANWHSDPF